MADRHPLPHPLPEASQGRELNAGATVLRGILETAAGRGAPPAPGAVDSPAWARWFATVVSVLLMLARVYVGLHYPLDVLGGAVVGLAVSALVRWAWRFVPSRLDQWLERLP
ncbi:MAG: phosphatase PAP2 family protein [Bacillota bacterium]